MNTAGPSEPLAPRRERGLTPTPPQRGLTPGFRGQTPHPRPASPDTPAGTAASGTRRWREPPQRIAVFRALQLGDMLCAIPALRALRQAAPQTHITLVGLANARGIVERYAHYVDELLVFPGLPGMPEQTPREDALPAFYAEARARRFDLAIQLHGSGGLTNPVVARLGAREVAGFVPAGVAPPSPLFMPWPEHLHEILRYTALMEHLGVPVRSHALEFPLTAADRAECDALVAERGMDPARTVIVHPGARLPSRRWPHERFAAVAGELAARGLRIAVTGSPDERAITRRLLDAMPCPADDLTGATSLGALAALVGQCRLVVSNDTGISHVAAAMRTPSVVVASGSDVNRWAPLDRERHTVLWHDMPCRPCAHDTCPLAGHPCAAGVPAEAVAEQAMQKLSLGEVHA